MNRSVEDIPVAGIFGFVLASVVTVLLVLNGISTIAERHIRNIVPFSNAIITILVVTSSVILTRLSGELLSKVHNVKGHLTPHQREVSYRFIQMCVYSGTLIITVSLWGINLSDILLGAGVLGLLTGLAARHALSSILSGMVIMLTNMFKVGDWIEYNQAFGRVTKITLFNTHIASENGETHIIPNDVLTSSELTNISDKGKYRNDIIIGVDYESDLEFVLDLCDQELSEAVSDDSHERIVGFQNTTIEEFSDSSIHVSVKFWIDEPNPVGINQTKTVIFEKIHTRFDKEGVNIPFNQITVSNRETDSENSQMTLNSIKTD